MLVPLIHGCVELRLLTPARTRSFDVSRLLRSGDNVVAVNAYNYGGPAALACLPRVKVTF